MKKSIVGAVFLIALLFGLVPCMAWADEEIITLSNYGFSDVSGDEWFATDDILGYATENGLITGYSNGAFGPYDNITRGQVATILWRMAGEPSASAADFSDVNYSIYYGDAIRWARAQGVISGYGTTNTFAPDSYVTRQELCVMLANYAKQVGGVSIATTGSKLASMPDAGDVSSWAQDAVAWCMDESIVTGAVVGSSSYVQPGANAQRCAAAKMISALCRDVLKLEDGEIGRDTTESMSLYVEKCNEYLTLYGEPGLKYFKSGLYTSLVCLTGLCFADLLDFDGDGVKELLLAYRNGTEGDFPKYVIELWQMCGANIDMVFRADTTYWDGGVQSLILGKYEGMNCVISSDTFNDTVHAVSPTGEYVSHSVIWDPYNKQWFIDGVTISDSDYESMDYSWETQYDFVALVGYDSVFDVQSAVKVRSETFEELGIA